MQARLKVLDLSDNALGEKGVRACAAALSSQVMPRPTVRLHPVSLCRLEPDEEGRACTGAAALSSQVSFTYLPKRQLILGVTSST